MSDDDAGYLVRILAAVDAVWLPVRNWSGNRVKNCHHARGLYPAVGVPWASEAKGEAGRKSAERWLSAAEAAGVLAVHRPRGKASAVRLGEAAEADARRTVGLPGVAASVAGVRKLAESSDRTPATMDRLWVPETVMAGVPWGGDTKPFVAVEDTLLPALARGWAVSNTDAHGRAYYRLTAAGWAVADAPDPVPSGEEEADDLDDYDPTHRRAYFDRLAVEAARLDTAAPVRSNELGWLPLPVSMLGTPVGGYR